MKHLYFVRKVCKILVFACFLVTFFPLYGCEAVENYIKTIESDIQIVTSPKNKYMSIQDFRFGMSPNEVDITVSKYGYSFSGLYKDDELNQIHRAQASYPPFSFKEEPSRWFFTFINKQLAHIKVEIKSDLTNTLRKLESIYDGYVVIEYEVGRDIFDTKKKIWKGKYKDIPNQFKNRKQNPHIISVRYRYIAHTQEYDVRYKYTGFVYSGEIIYSIKNYNKIVNQFKGEKKRNDNIKRKQRLKKEYDELIL